MPSSGPCDKTKTAEYSPEQWVRAFLDAVNDPKNFDYRPSTWPWTNMDPRFTGSFSGFLHQSMPLAQWIGLYQADVNSGTRKHLKIMSLETYVQGSKRLVYTNIEMTGTFVKLASQHVAVWTFQQDNTGQWRCVEHRAIRGGGEVGHLPWG